MENARVSLIEDDPSHIELVEAWLGIKHHRVISKAETLPKALALIDSINSGGVEKPDAIILDGHLSIDAYMCSDAKAIFDRYKRHGMIIPIIGYSSIYLCENEININERFDIGKNPKELLRIIDVEL